MQITEVRIKLMIDSDDRLQGFCSITFDDSFVVRDLKIIEGSNGPFVAMPSRKLTGHCNHCGCKNHLKAQYCNQCGGRQREDRLLRDADGRAKLYADIAHPINSTCREMIQSRVIAEYRAEVERSKMPGYTSRYDEDYDDDLDPADLTAPVAKRIDSAPSPVVAPAASAPPVATAAPLPLSPPDVTSLPAMPAGSHLEPAETEIRAPHILPAVIPAATKSAEPTTQHLAGPHLPQAPNPLHSPDSEKTSRRTSGNDFGAGIF